MSGRDVRASRAAVLLRCAEIDSNLQSTKERLNHAAQQFRDLAEGLLPARGSEQQAANDWFRERYGERRKRNVSEAALRRHISRLAETIAQAPRHDERTRRLRATSAEQHGTENSRQGSPELQGEDA